MAQLDMNRSIEVFAFAFQQAPRSVVLHGDLSTSARRRSAFWPVLRGMNQLSHTWSSKGMYPGLLSSPDFCLSSRYWAAYHALTEWGQTLAWYSRCRSFT